MKASDTTRYRRRGLTFVEVIIAFAVLMTTMLPAMTVLSRLRRYQAMERNLVNAIQLCDNKLHEIETRLDYEDILDPLDGATVEMTEDTVKGVAFSYTLAVEEQTLWFSIATPDLNAPEWSQSDPSYNFFDFDLARDIIRLPLTSADEPSFKKLTLTVTWKDRPRVEEERRVSVVSFKARLM